MRCPPPGQVWLAPPLHLLCHRPPCSYTQLTKCAHGRGPYVSHDLTAPCPETHYLRRLPSFRKYHENVILLTYTRPFVLTPPLCPCFHGVCKDTEVRYLVYLDAARLGQILQLKSPVRATHRVIFSVYDHSGAILRQDKHRGYLRKQVTRVGKHDW